MPPLSLMPLLPFTLVFIIGIVLQGSGVGVAFMAVPLAVSVILLVCKKNCAAVLTCGLLLGYAVAFVNSPSALPGFCAGGPRTYSAIAREVRSYEPTRIVIAEVDSCGGNPCRPFLLKLTIPSSLPELPETYRFRFTAGIRPLVGRTELPEEIDYDAPLRRRGVVGDCFLRPDSLDVLHAEAGLLNSVRRFRPELSRMIAASPLSPSAKEFLDATLTGDRSMLTPDMRDVFSATGLSHVLALSGLHVGILVWIASIMLFPLYAGGLGGVRTAILIVLLWLFAVMTGLVPSVVRSVIMATVFLVAYSSQRNRSPFNSLCVAALAILFVAPYSLWTVGFQLSFMAVASILLFAGRLNPFPQRRRLLYGLAAYPAATLAAMIGTMALSAYHFNILPLYFLPANFIGALLLPLILGLGVVFLIFDFSGLTLHPLADFISTLVAAFYESASWFDSLPYSSLKDVYVTPLMLIFWMLAVVPFALWLYRKRMAYLCATLIMVLCAFSSSLYADDAGDGYIETYIPASRTSTSILVRENSRLHVITNMPEHRHAELLDGYMRKYRRYLLSRGIDSIRMESVSPARLLTVTAGDRNMAVVAHERHAVPRRALHVDYALVCGGFRGDILSVARSIGADTILLSGDINIRRHDRYLRELSEAGIPARTLRDSVFSYRVSYAPWASSSR